MDNTFGTLYRTTTFGESHSAGVGAVIDGCPAGIEINEEIIQKQLDRRKPGTSKLTTQRNESDAAIILSGVEKGITLGTPIAVLVKNKDFRPNDYAEFSNVPRPSHADFTYKSKFGITAASGGGRASARETIGRVISGAIAMEVLKKLNIEITATIENMGDVEAAIAEKDSVGGIITCVCKNVPSGLGNPVFDKIDALLAQAMLSIPAAKGFEIGSGFSAASMKGSEHNDIFVMESGLSANGVLRTKTNNSGGVQGGITNGENIFFNVAFKPTATIGQTQLTADYDGNTVSLEGKGRHDPCVAIRAVPVVESMAAIVILDCLLRQKAIG